jgi:uncharacterized protein (DUF433 family)
MPIPGHPRIDARPGVCGGKPTIVGTRMRVTDILGALSAGDSEDEIIADFPHITREDIRACLAYAAEATAHPLPLAAE